MRLAESNHLPSVIVSSDLYIEGVGSDEASVVVEVRGTQRIFCTYSIVPTNRKVVLMCGYRIIEEKDPSIPVHRAVWQRIKWEVGLHCGTDSYRTRDEVSFPSCSESNYLLNMAPL